MPLTIKLSDLFRATLPERSGNLGFIGISPDGSAYHVVVPVDLQIAKGVKACNRPTDGTPFGGYKDWRYFPCPAYVSPDSPAEETILRRRKARENFHLLSAWAAEMGIELHLDIDQ
jgi:hypothetical protein